MGAPVGQSQLTPEQQMRPFEAAYQAWLQSLHGLVTSHERQQQVAAAFGQYTQLMQSGGIASAEMEQLASEAYARYLETLQQTMTSVTTRAAAAEAYRRYVRAVKAAWAALDA